MADDPRFSDLVNSREDIPKLRERLKAMAKQRRSVDPEFKVDDLLAQSRKNDAAYINPSDLEKAEWFQRIYKEEGEPEIHPRGFHYQILGKYETRNGEKYVNSNRCWNELKDAIKWARILGLVDNDNIRDNKNGVPTTTAFDDPSKPRSDAELGSLGSAAAGTVVNDGYRPPRIPREITPAKLDLDDLDEFVHRAAVELVEYTFERLYFDEMRQQRYYIELWSEKADVIPEEVAAEYGATIRPAGGGEFSLSMVQDAIRIARTRNQDLAIVIVSDFDPKGADMPISAARKAEVEGAIHGVEVELVQGAVTKEQVQAYSIPGEPADTPRGLDSGVAGAKGYETQKDQFEDFAEQHPVEIRAFKTRYPAAYKTEIEECLKPYYDSKLGTRIKDSVEEARQDAYDAMVEAFNEHRDEIEEAFDDLHRAMDQYHGRMEGSIAGAMQGLDQLHEQEQDVRSDVGIPQKRNQLVDALDAIDHHDVLASVDIQLPDPEAPGVDGPLLDTRRTLLEQIDSYRAFNIRS